MAGRVDSPTVLSYLPFGVSTPRIPPFRQERIAYPAYPAPVARGPPGIDAYPGLDFCFWWPSEGPRSRGSNGQGGAPPLGPLWTACGYPVDSSELPTAYTQLAHSLPTRQVWPGFCKARNVPSAPDYVARDLHSTTHAKARAGTVLAQHELCQGARWHEACTGKDCAKPTVW